MIGPGRVAAASFGTLAVLGNLQTVWATLIGSGQCESAETLLAPYVAFIQCCHTLALPNPRDN